MQRQTPKKDAWRPKCAAPGLVHGLELFFETFKHVYVRTTYDQICSAKKKKKLREVRSRDGHLENMCKISGSIS